MSVSFTQCGNSVDKELKRQAEQMNNMCPMELGGGVRLDEVTAESGKKLNYVFTFTQMIAGSEEAQMTASIFKPMMVETFRTNNSQEYVNIRKIKPTLIFKINDKNGELITDVEIKPEDYAE